MTDIRALGRTSLTLLPANGARRCSEALELAPQRELLLLLLDAVQADTRFDPVAPFHDESLSARRPSAASYYRSGDELFPLAPGHWRVGAVSVICRLRVGVVRHDPPRYAASGVSLSAPKRASLACRVRLSEEQRREAVALLADLLLEAASS